MTPISNLVYCEHLFTSLGGNFAELINIADQGLQFLKDLRANGFSKGLECEVKLLLLKCKALTSKKIDIAKDKKAKEFK